MISRRHQDQDGYIMSYHVHAPIKSKLNARHSSARPPPSGECATSYVLRSLPKSNLDLSMQSYAATAIQVTTKCGAPNESLAVYHIDWFTFQRYR